MRRFLRTYRVLIKNELSARMAYRFDFITGVIVSLLGEMLLPLITLLIYSTGASFKDWTYHEVLLIQSVFIMSLAVANTLFFGMVNIVMSYVKEGTFDLFLIKPGSVSLMAAGMSFSFDNVFVFMGGLGLFIYSLFSVPSPSLIAWIQFILVFIMGIAVLLGITLIMSATMFKWVGNSRLFEIFNSVSQFARYPTSIYSKSFRVVITYAIPVALLGPIPAAVLLKPDSLDKLILAVVFAILFWGVGFLIWRLMLRSYTSSGG